MPVATNVSSSVPQPRSMVRRKPAPSIVLDARYPCPDPDDPFAPLSVLRTRTASTLGLLTFAGDSTSHLPILPYTGGSPFPPDPYQATPPASPDVASPDQKPGSLTTYSTRSSFDISQNLHDTTESGRWPPQFSRCDSPSIRTLPTPQRRRSRSAVSRKEARTNTCPVSPGTSPYGHTNLQAYVLASSRFPSPAHSSQPFRMQHIGHGSESLLPLVIPIARHDSAPVLSLLSEPSSRASTFSPEPTHTSRSRVKKLARFLPRKSRSGLSLAEFSSETANVKHHQHHRSFPSMAVALGASSERPSKEKHVPEENTFRPRRKSSMSMLFPAVVAANMQSLDVSYPSTGTSIYDSPTSAEPGYMSEPSSSSLYSPSGLASVTSELAPLTPKKPRPQTMQPQQRLVDSNGQSSRKKPSSRPSTAPSNFAHVFDENALPTKRQLLDAASCVVVAENGIRVPFGDLFREQKTVVIFIRHFWCPLCQDYMFSIANTVDPQVLKQSGINLVIISNGSYNMIRSYRLYTDPSSRIYGILGMTVKAVESKAEQRRSSYVRHSRAGGIAMVIANALRVGMPVWEKAGDPTQLGGEFVLGPGMTASYAHRMRSRSSHAPIVRVLTAAGVHVYLRSEKPKSVISSDPAGRASLVLEVDEEQWMEERRRSLARIRERKQARRLGVCVPPSDDSSFEQDTERQIRHVASHMTRTDSIAEEDEEYVIPIMRPKAGDSISSPLRDTDVDEPSDSTEDDDTDDSSVDTQSMTGSDTVSEKGHVGLSNKSGAVEFIHDLSPPIPLLI
ncbi:hypothetical protein EV424DRAFT_917786 [Suillus variegatus]|nr:hypothetical protein EV424DRAFT_917786 [Suillus variegatus]